MSDPTYTQKSTSTTESRCTRRTWVARLQKREQFLCALTVMRMKALRERKALVDDGQVSRRRRRRRRRHGRVGRLASLTVVEELRHIWRVNQAERAAVFVRPSGRRVGVA